MATASGGTAQSELLGYLRRPSAPEERSVLQMTQDNGDVVELTRLRKVNGITVSLQIAILPAHFLDNISELDESLYWHLEKREHKYCGQPSTSAQQLRTVHWRTTWALMSMSPFY